MKTGSAPGSSDDQGVSEWAWPIRAAKVCESFGGVLPPIPQQVYFDMHTPALKTEE